MSVNQAIYIEREESDFADGFVKLYAQGKIGLLFSGDGKFAKAADECFRRALEISVSIDTHSFAREMRNRGASEKAIHEFLENYTLVDEVHLSPILN